MRLTAIALIALAVASVAPVHSAAWTAATLIVPTTRDGHDDFNFLHGRWKTHYRILRRRLVHDTHWDECDGTALITPYWNNYGNLEVGTLDCPLPRGFVNSMTLRTYSAETHQWHLWWGTKKLGVSPPPQVGHFDSNGIGDFFADDTWEGKTVIVRYRWTTVKGLPHFEQAFSTDGGISWETNWICDYTHA